MTLGDNFPEIPSHPESRKIALGFRDISAKINFHKVTYIYNGENEPMEDIAERFVLSAKLLSGMTLGQLREAMNGSNIRVYYTPEES